MYSKWTFAFLTAAAALAASACDDEIVDVDIPKDAAAAARDGATSDAPIGDPSDEATLDGGSE